MTSSDDDSAALDELVLKAVMIDARRYVVGGLSVDEAAKRASNGAWRSYRHDVARRLHEEDHLLQSISTATFVRRQS